MNNTKLYLVKCRGMLSSSVITRHVSHGVAYVIADNPTEAYEKLRHYLDEKNIGKYEERELHSVELAADSEVYPNCGTRLYV